MIALEEVSLADTARYGIVSAEKAGEGVYRVRDMVEKPGPEKAPGTLAIMGRYVLTPTVFSILKTQEKGAGGEIQLTDALRTLAGKEPVWE